MSGWWVAAFVVQWVLLLVLGVTIVALARQVGTLHLRLGPRGALEIDTEGPEVGSVPAPIRARSDRGTPVRIGGSGPAKIVLFASPTCSICHEVAPAIPAVARAAGLAAVVVHDEAAEQAFDVPGTPFLVVLDDQGAVRAKGTVNNLEQVEGLVDTARRRVDEERWAS